MKPSTIVTPGRIVLVRLAHGWRQPAIVLSRAPRWSERNPVTVHVFDQGDADLEAFLPDLARDYPDKREEVATRLLNTGAKVSRAQGFVIVDLPEVDPNDEHAVGWFFPPREGSR